MRERDAELFVYEFFGNHSHSGDAPTLTRTLNQILNKESEKLWKKACASARARLSRPAKTESSDDLRRQFAPIIKARSLAVQRFRDPSGRGLFQSNIEFSSPCATLKLNCQKIKREKNHGVKSIRRRSTTFACLTKREGKDQESHGFPYARVYEASCEQ